MTLNLEQLVPGLAELRAQERQHRALAFAGLTWTLCGRQVRPLNPRHRLVLQMLRNAFTVPAAVPLAGDVFEFLWLLSPAWAARGIRAKFRQWRLRRLVRRLDVPAATQEIYSFLLSQLQDATEQCGDPGIDNSAWIHWVADDASFWLNIHGGFTLESYLETPYLVLQQLYRAWKCNHPRVNYEGGRGTVEAPQFINASDLLVSLWHRQQRDSVVAEILSQRERRN